VVVHDLGCEDDGMVWQRMELLEGAAVGDLLGRHGAFSPLYAIEVALEIAAGLQAAHERQIIHRDIHPFNVFLCAEGRVKVLDFSMAKVIASGLQTTRGSRAMGTEGYMAPEYLKGRVVTPQLDVYALGMLFWEMLVGHHPFRVAGVDMLTLVRRCLEEDPPSLVGAAGLPAYCDEVIRGATARDPARRFAGMWGLIQALQGLRERLLGDPEAAVVVMRKRWERQHPIGEPGEGYAAQAEMAGVPAAITVPPVTARRVVVAGESRGGEESRRVVAKTVPMGVVGAVGEVGGGGVTERRSAPTVMMSMAMVPAGVTGSGVDVGAPTVRGGARPRRWVVWVVVVAAVVTLGALVAWLLAAEVTARTAPETTARTSTRPPTVKPTIAR
jgi:serine/threonine-protein kinase